MFERVFPATVDNRYHGHPVAKWLLGLYVIKSLFSGSVHVFAPDGGAQSIASITLDAFSEGAANTVITIFGMWGMEQVVIGLIGALVLWRYKALIPAMTLVYVIEYLGRFGVHFVTPGVVTVSEPPGVVADYILVPLTIVMFLLATHRKGDKA